MGSFTAPLTVTWLPEEKKFRAEVPFEFHSVKKNSGLFCSIKKGDKSDLASVPLPFRMLIPKLGSDAQGAFIHDKGYQTGMLTVRVPTTAGAYVTKDVPVTKGMIDSMYFETMLVLKTNPIRREAIMLGLTIGGWYTWNKYRAKDIVQRIPHHSRTKGEK